jgi:hypothetical protein
MVEIIFDSGNGIRQVFEGGTLTFQVKGKIRTWKVLLPCQAPKSDVPVITKKSRLLE